MDGLFVLIGMAAVGLLIYAAASFVEIIPKIRLRFFERRLKNLSQGKLLSLALRLDKDRAFSDAVAAQISDAETLLQIGREAAYDSMKEAARARHCQLYGHRLDERCVCGVCMQEFHDFRDAEGRTSTETSDLGEYACTRCPAVFCREYVPGCKDTCDNLACNGEGKIECYSSQSGQGGSWLEDCDRYAPSSIRETIRYQKQAINSTNGGSK